MKLKEIAKLTGTSPSAVSRVMNSNGYVAEEKRILIEKALKEYGFEKKIPEEKESPFSKMVLVIADSLSVSDAYVDYIDGLNEQLEEAGYCSHIFLSGDAQEKELEQILNADRTGFAGVMMISAIESPALYSVIKKKQLMYCSLPQRTSNRKY